MDEQIDRAAIGVLSARHARPPTGLMSLGEKVTQEALEKNENLEFRLTKAKWELAEAKRTIRGLTRAVASLNDIIAARVEAPKEAA